MQLKYKKKHRFKLCACKRYSWSKQWHPSRHGQVFPWKKALWLTTSWGRVYLSALSCLRSTRKQEIECVNCFNFILSRPTNFTWMRDWPMKQPLNLKWADSVCWGYVTCTFTHMFISPVLRRHVWRLICIFAWWWIMVIAAEHLPKNESVKLTMEQAYN